MTMKFISVALLVTSLGIVSISARGEEESGNCSGSSQTEMNYCAAERFQRADDKMNSLYKQLLSQLETTKTKERLRDSQRVWIGFRDKACLYEAGPREESGSIWILEQQSCMEYHTRKRIEDLKKYISCTQNGCPN